MIKLIYLCSTILLTTYSIAQARVEFIAKDDGISFKSPKSVGCPEGMRNYNGKCFPICRKTMYPFATKPDAKKGEIDTCVGVPPRYRYKECYVGYEGASNGDCVLRDCSAYPLKENEVNRSIGNVEPCQSGDGITYKYTKCYNHNAWDLENGKCVPHYCQTNLYPYDYDASAPNDKVGHHKFCYSGEKTYWGYTDCIQPDWKLENGQCWNQCTGYNSLTTEINGCTQTNYCAAKDGTKYKCVQCKSGYEINNTNTCDVISCPYGQVDPERYWCDDKWKYFIPEKGCEAATCNLGDIYYSDDTCSSTLVSGKTPIGVVYDTNKRLVMSLNRYQTNWCTIYDDNYSLLMSLQTVPDDGYNNTAAIIAYGQQHAITCPAVEFCHNMTTGGKNWFLPAQNEMYFVTDWDFSLYFRRLGEQISQNFPVEVHNSIAGSWESTYYDGSAAGFASLSTLTTRHVNEYADARCVFSY